MSQRSVGLGRRLDAARLLGLAASPVFAVMALVTVSTDHSAASPTCVGADHMPALSGMPFMYLLMAVFHSLPWMTLIRSR
jgi:hypothetical protein